MHVRGGVAVGVRAAGAEGLFLGVITKWWWRAKFEGSFAGVNGKNCGMVAFRAVKMAGGQAGWPARPAAEAAALGQPRRARRSSKECLM